MKKKRDWCTLYPDGTWSGCCKRHDHHYARKTRSKLQADLALYRCVKRTGHPVHAALMFIGVTLFGWPFWWRAKPITGPVVAKVRRRPTQPPSA